MAPRETMAFWQFEIITDVGISMNTVTDSVKLLRVVNADFPVARRFNDDQHPRSCSR